MKVKLRDVSNIIMGQSPDSSTYNTENIGLPFFQGNADFGELNPIAKTWCSAPIKIAYKNYILISVRAPIGALNIAAETCCIGRGLAALDVNNKICTQKYLWYLLEAKKNELISKGTGSTFKAISKNILSEMEFNIPPVREQELCTKTLDVVFYLIRLKKEQLDKLDLLVKSRFIEMFHNKGYPIKDIESISFNKGEYGAQSASSEYDSNRPRYVRITDINDDGTLNDDFVSSSNLKDDDTYRLKYGDFLFARMGATVGKTYAFKSGNLIFAGYLIKFALKTDIVLPEYLFAYTKTNEYLSWVKNNQSGAAQPGINAKKYGSLRLPIPPIGLQNQFADFVAQVDKSKFVVTAKFQ